MKILNTPVISVVIPHWNAGLRTIDCIEQIASWSLPQAKIQLIIMDHASQDGSSESLRVYVKENAKKYKVSVKSELLKVFVHGILHLCGYDHEKSEAEEKIMEAKQEKYLSKVK